MINIGLITAKQAKLRPNAWAVYDQSSKKRITFLELDEQVKKIANGLIDLGLEKGDRVSILSQNTIEFLALFFACGRVGLVAHALNWRLGSDELVQIIENGQPKLIITQGQFSETTRDLQRKINFIDHWLEYGSDSNSSFDKLIAKASSNEPITSSIIGDEDPFFILYTGGTTGISKGALHTHRSAYFGTVSYTHLTLPTKVTV